jgi:hypothetical protein
MDSNAHLLHSVVPRRHQLQFGKHGIFNMFTNFCSEQHRNISKRDFSFQFLVCLHAYSLSFVPLSVVVYNVTQDSVSLNWGSRGRDLVQGGDALLFIAKTYSCWELTFALALPTISDRPGLAGTVPELNPLSRIPDGSYPGCKMTRNSRESHRPIYCFHSSP